MLDISSVFFSLSPFLLFVLGQCLQFSSPPDYFSTNAHHISLRPSCFLGTKLQARHKVNPQAREKSRQREQQHKPCAPRRSRSYQAVYVVYASRNMLRTHVFIIYYHSGGTCSSDRSPRCWH
ncbi:hypothetical protein V8C37DRAFT_392829 [Trichoderma ceciliae]